MDEVKISGSSVSERRQAMKSALGSVAAEGLTPTPEAVARMEQYVKGDISSDQLLELTLDDVRAMGSNGG